MRLQARQFQIQFPRPAMLMGIVNATPDSFSDGGKFFNPARAVAHARRLAAEGASPVAEAEELRRVIPVIEELVRGGLPDGVLISVDTMKPAVARAAVAAGAVIINDVAAHRTDRAMWDVVRASGAGYVVMHMQGTPPTMQQEPRYDDVVREVGEFFAERLNALRAHGVSADQIIFDPGFGFGKTTEHNLELLAGLSHFTTQPRPVLVGVSRKGFIGQVSGAGEAADRLPGSLAGACAAVAQGARIIRTHDVAATRQALRLTEALQARRRK
jgi:dihydropteroate synthase